MIAMSLMHLDHRIRFRLVPSRRMLAHARTAIKFVLLVAFLAFSGFAIGVMTVVLPPLAWIGVISFAGLILLWRLPDVPLFSERTLNWMLFIAVIVQFTVPVYYAFTGPGLPWISIRRIVWFPTVAVAGLMLASSHQIQQRLAAALHQSREVSYPVVAYFSWLCVSIFTSLSWTETLASIWNSFLHWTMVYIISLICIRTESQIRAVIRVFCVLSLFAGVLGFAEFLTQEHFIVDLWPDFLMQQLFAQNPQLYDNIVRDAFRNGQFRANYVYNVSLSFGEFLAVCASLALFFALHGRNASERVLGIVAVVFSVLGVYASGARGGYLGLAISLPFIAILALVRHIKEKPNSISGAIAGMTFLGLVTAFAILAVAWKPLRWKFTGGYEGAGSTDVRWQQWDMALPSIIANPVTGYGHGVGNNVVGYFTPGGIRTVDSYVITLLVETGVPGLLFFASMIGLAIFSLVRIYLTDPHPQSTTAGCIAGSLLSFGAYRIGLTQTENHFLLFLLLGLASVQIAESRARMGAVAKASQHRPEPAFRGPKFAGAAGREKSG